MALQSNVDLRLLNGLLPISLFGGILGFLTISFYAQRLSACRSVPNLEGPSTVFITLGGKVAQLYTQAPGAHFSRLLLHAWAAVGLLFSPVSKQGKFRPHTC